MRLNTTHSTYSQISKAAFFIIAQIEWITEHKPNESPKQYSIEEASQKAWAFHHKNIE